MNRYVSCATSAMRRRRSSSRSSRRSTPSEHDAAFLRDPRNAAAGWRWSILPAPDGADQRHRLRRPASSKSTSVQRRRGAAGIGEAHVPRSAPSERRAGRGKAPSAIGTGSDCTTCSRRVEAMVSASWRPTWAISDDRQEGRDRHQHQQRQPSWVEPALRRTSRRAEHGDRQAAKARRDLQPGGLCAPDRAAVPGASSGSAAHVAMKHRAAAVRWPGTRSSSARPWIVSVTMGAELAQRVARLGCRADRCVAARKTGASPRTGQERQQHNARAAMRPMPAVASTAAGISTATKAGATVWA